MSNIAQSKEDVMANRAKQLAPSTQFAIVTCLPNTPYGATWVLQL